MARAILMTLLIVAAACSCSNVEQSNNKKRDGSDDAVRDPSNLSKDRWPEIRLSKGQFKIFCFRGPGESSDLVISDFSKTSMQKMFETCSTHYNPQYSMRPTTVIFDGEIVRGFADVIARLNALYSAAGVKEATLVINSGGGDVEEAMLAGNELSKMKWTIVLNKGSVCFSSCVLILAAGSTRLISGGGAGPVGIHRLIPESSTASNIDELNSELQQA